MPYDKSPPEEILCPECGGKEHWVEGAMNRVYCSLCHPPNVPYPPSRFYHAMLGHDLHVSSWGELRGRAWHRGWADPYTGEVQSAIDPTFSSLFATHFVDHVCDLA